MARTDDRPKTSIPTNDAWTGMLAISLVALLAGSVFLLLDWMHYSSKPPKLTPTPLVQEQAPKEEPKEPAEKAVEEKKDKGG
ncbi:MAG: hypothetical protein L0Z62_42940 [Gemmataceae bacterium]|nr:hypothetical protein [Gemmataceae bacterium]